MVPDRLSYRVKAQKRKEKPLRNPIISTNLDNINKLHVKSYFPTNSLQGQRAVFTFGINFSRARVLVST